jgi:hypothetical protein
MQQLDAIRRSQRQKGNASQLNLFGMFVFSALGLGILNLFILIGLFASLNRLSQKAPPSLVQTDRDPEIYDRHDDDAPVCIRQTPTDSG